MDQIISGRYQVLETLGRGGMGVVYKARDLQLGRPVALKVLPEELAADAVALRRLRHEAVAASALNHPHICTVYELGDTGGQLYIVMEFIEGQPLCARVGPPGLPPEAVRRYGIQLADALAHAHARGVIHRDLKSSNVMVTADDRIKVLDFGIAKLLPSADVGGLSVAGTTLTTPGMVTGTLPYVAPEILFGEPATAQSDLWSLGVVLHEAATGRLPFVGRTPFELCAVLLAERAPALPAGAAALEPVVRRCLAREVADRYPSASDVRAALEAVELRPAAGVAHGAPPPARSRGRRRSRRVRSLAVLPLTNLSARPDHEYLADALTDSLLADFAQVSALRVISRSSVMRYRESRAPVSEIARELDVDAVVEGSVQRDGDRVRLTAHLVHAPTGRQLWAGSYERDFGDLLALQRELAQAVVSEIEVRLRPRERSRLAAPARTGGEANDAYFHGIYHFDRMELDRGMQYFRQAVTLDPSHADAYGRLARGYYHSLFFGALPPGSAYELLDAAAARALVLDHHQAEAYGYRALGRLYYGWDWDGADADFRRALALKPSHAELRHAYGHYLMVVGRGEEALRECQRASELDPLGLILTACLGWHCLFSREYDAALEPALRALRMDPDLFWAHLILGWASQQKGMLEQAIGAYRRATALSAGTPITVAALAHALAVAGQRDESHGLLRQLEQRARTSYVSAYDVAVVHVGLGDRDRAFAWLERAYEERSSFLIHIEWDARFDTIRDDPRFDALLRRVGLPRILEPASAIVTLPRTADAHPDGTRARHGGRPSRRGGVDPVRP